MWGVVNMSECFRLFDAESKKNCLGKSMPGAYVPVTRECQDDTN
jgi:hypothetical protein